MSNSNETNKKIINEELANFFETHEWTQGFYARKQDGSVCFGDNLKAHSFCMVGAINVFFPNYSSMCPIINQLIDFLQNKTGFKNISEFNDRPERTKEEVNRIFKECFGKGN